MSTKETLPLPEFLENCAKQLAEIDSLRTRLDAVEKELAQKKFPDIGTDPLKHDNWKTYRSTEAMKERIMEAMSVQQKEVPDQTALVWRIDISQLHGEHTQQAAYITSLQSQLAQLKQTIDALTSSNCNMNDTLRSRGFTGGSTEDRVIAMAQALDKAQQANAELVKDKERLEKLANLIWQTRWVSEDSDYQDLVGTAAEIRSGNFNGIDAAITKGTV